MATHNPSSRAALQAFVVVALAALVVAYTLPDLRRVWQSPGVMGFVADQDNVIINVAANPSAVKAGLKDGDRIDMAATTPEFRIVAADAGVTRSPGQRVTFAVVRGSQERDVTITSEPFELSSAEKALLVGRLVAMLLFVGIGAALVLLRPSAATWGFFFYCLGLNGAPAVVSPTLLDEPWNWIIIVLSQALLPAAAFVGVAVFALHFLHENITGWRATVYRLTPIALVVMCGLETYGLLGPTWFGLPANGAENLLLLFQGAIALVAMYALVATYFAARGNDRQRIRWVVLAFTIALISAVLANMPVFLFRAPYWLYAAVQLSGVVVPLAVAYAVIRHRVIDVSFVVSRALVYGVLTAGLVGGFAIVDWLFIEKLKLARLGTIAEIGVAVAAGFWFNALHRRVDTFIDATFFRQRHRAEVQLARVATALPLATTTSAVANCLVSEPVRAMSLASAALFRRSRDGIYTREQAEGWGTTDLSRLDEADETLLMLAQTENGPLSLYDHSWRPEGVPSGPAHPVIALPIMVRRELAAIVFYGAHVHGEGLDPDEIKAIAGLAPGAAAAYDHLEAQAWKNEVESLRTQLAEAQIQPA